MILESRTRESSKRSHTVSKNGIFLFLGGVDVCPSTSRAAKSVASALWFLTRRSVTRCWLRFSSTQSSASSYYSTAAPIIATGTTYLMTFITGVACAAAPITEAVAMGDTLE